MKVLKLLCLNLLHPLVRPRKLNLVNQHPIKENEFFIAENSETGRNHATRIGFDGSIVDKTVKQLRLTADGVFSSFRSSMKSIHDAESERKMCRPMFLTSNKIVLRNHSFAPYHLLNALNMHSYFEAFLSRAEREVEKQSLSKRYELFKKGKFSRGKRKKNDNLVPILAS